MLYLLHSTRPVGGTGKFSARHYLGYCRADRLEARLKEHRSGQNTASLVKAFLGQGATLLLAATFPNASRGEETRLKRLGHLKRWCPLCTPSLTLPAVHQLPRRRPSQPRSG